MAYRHPNAGNSSSTDHSSHQGQALPDSDSESTSLFCSKCKTPCGRIQELKRHMLSAHFPCYLHCPHSSCSWRGHRKEEFRVHLRVHPGSDADVDPCPIYNTKMILDFIKEGTPIETAAGYALDLVSERARELGFVAEWSNPWG